MKTMNLNKIENEDLLLDLISNDRVGEFTAIMDTLDYLYDKRNVSFDEVSSLIGYMDLTSLESTDSEEKIRDLIDKSEFECAGINYKVAGICSFVNFLPYMSSRKKSADVKSVVVCGGFPHAQMPLNIKKEEVKYALENGANEIDICINKGLFLSGREKDVANEISSIKNLISAYRKPVLLKVILEVGELNSLSKIRKASLLALENGADFIKTSTGKINRGADKYSVCVMLLTLREYYRKHGILKGLKVAGGIRSCEDALMYGNLFDYFISKDLKTSSRFRIGCSRLLESVKMEMEKSK